MKRIILAVVLLVWAPSMALAQEGGSATVEFESNSFEFQVNDGQSDWSGTLTYGSASLVLNAPEEAGLGPQALLMVGFSFSNGTADLADIGIIRMQDRDNLFGDADLGAGVRIGDISVSGDFLSISGSFEASLGISKDYGSNIDMSNPHPIGGTFNVVLGPVEF